MAPTSAEFACNANKELIQEIESIISDNETSIIEDNLKSTEMRENKHLLSMIKNKQDPKSNYHVADNFKYHENWLEINRDNRNANFDSNRSFLNISNWSSTSGYSSGRGQNHSHGNWLAMKHTFTELSKAVGSVTSEWPSSSGQQFEDSRVPDDSLGMFNVSPSSLSESSVTEASSMSQSTSSSIESYPADVVEENSHRDYPVIKTVEDDFEGPNTIHTDPIIGNSQLFGDGYFLQLCMRYTKYPYTRKNESSPITCGTVQSGLTIKKAIERLKNICIMSNKLIICVGTVDIYCQRPFDEMIADYKEMLQILSKKFGYSSNQIILCTLPPMGNVDSNGEKFKYDTFVMFNHWIRYHSEIKGHKLIDFHEAFSCKVQSKLQIDSNYFQAFARKSSGTIHPHVLWNYNGRQKAMKMLLMA